MSQKSDPHAGHRPGSFLEAVSWLNRSAYGEKLSCYSLREAVAQVVERECYLRREIERLEAERDALLSKAAPPADAAREDAVTAWARLAVALLSRHESAWEHDPGPGEDDCDEDCRACEYVGLLRTGRAALSSPAPAPSAKETK